MPNWFAIYKTADNSLVSVETDDALQRVTDVQLASQGMARVAVSQQPDATHQWNPGSKTVAVVALSGNAAMLQTLLAKSSATWTLADVADWLKAKA
jgi:hypothetical protein